MSTMGELTKADVLALRGVELLERSLGGWLDADVGRLASKGFLTVHLTDRGREALREASDE